MSKFFKALEQAERERALRDPGGPPESEPTPPPPAPPAEAVAAAPEAPPAPPRPASPPRPAPTRVREAGPAAPSAATPRVREAARTAPPSRPQAVEPAPGPVIEPPAGLDGHLVSLLRPGALEAEQYRALRHLVEQLHKTANLSVLAVSSPATGDGKTTTAINLAGALAQDPKARVLLIDADLRASAIAERLGLTASGKGLVGAILDPATSLAEVAQPCPPFNFSLLQAGERPRATYELLKSPRLGQLLEEARGSYDHIVLDSPPLVPFPDGRVLEKWVDGVILVVGAHRTPRKFFEEALNMVDASKLMGLVFNADDRPLSGYYSGYYRYVTEPPANGRRTAWLRQAVKRVGGSLRRPRVRRMRRDGQSPRGEGRP
jgi:capsular exopolysaccharide synthesis family protein